MRLLLLRLRGPALEPLDAAAGVDQLLLARKEGVALRAELDAEAGHGRAGRELVPAGTVDLALDVVGVDVGLHDLSSVPVPRAQWPRRPAPRRESGGDASGAHDGRFGDLVEEFLVALRAPQLVDQQFQARRTFERMQHPPEL